MFTKVESLISTEKGARGFGSTGSQFLGNFYFHFYFSCKKVTFLEVEYSNRSFLSAIKLLRTYNQLVLGIVFAINILVVKKFIILLRTKGYIAAFSSFKIFLICGN